MKSLDSWVLRDEGISLKFAVSTKLDPVTICLYNDDGQGF